jgi:multidrug efflux pump subunit AcrB
MTPVSFIGCFLTFYLFNINFDEGGYAAFILLCGISVSGPLYILNDFNISRSRENSATSLIDIFFYAIQFKIVTVLLTICTVIIAMIPFLFEENNLAFWTSFSAGLIGGLIVTLISTLILFPAISLPILIKG